MSLKTNFKTQKSLNKAITACTKCPRLIKHCQKIAKEKRAAFKDWNYWGKPVPDFGDPNAELMIMGLAPAAHGANRTGRMFTGDRSGDWLYKALHKAGFANQPNSTDAKDGLKLNNAVISAVAHCAPPDNKPLRQEVENCSHFFKTSLKVYPIKVYLALGSISWNALCKEFKEQGWLEGARPKFGHGVKVKLGNGQFLVGSYHPSQQNTFTKRLTEPMFNKVFADINKVLKK